jgi:hypothetical protein
MIPDEEIREAWEEARSIRGGARLVGLSKTGFRKRVDKLGLRDEADDRALQAGMAAVGTDITPRLVWAKTKPDEGGVAYSVLIKPEEKGPTDRAEQIREIMNGIERVDALPQTERCSSDLLGLIILSDIHVGMLAWGKETGVPYDTAERDAYASSRLYRGRANIKAVIYSSATGKVERKVISNEVIQSRSPEETLGA